VAASALRDAIYKEDPAMNPSKERHISLDEAKNAKKQKCMKSSQSFGKAQPLASLPESVNELFFCVDILT
jgi:hypothetical protein